LRRLGIELTHTLMSEWLIQCYPLLEDLHRRMIRKVLYSGHVYANDTTLPLQKDDPERRKTFEAKLWVYAKDHGHGPPLIVYEFSRSRSRDAPLSFLANYRGYLQADAYPGYDPLLIDGAITEVACNVHARRKFVEAADLLKTPGRPHQTLAFYRQLLRIERRIARLDDTAPRGAAAPHGSLAQPIQGMARPGGAQRAAEGYLRHRGQLRPEALGRSDALPKGRARRCLEQLCRALHAPCGSREKNFPARGFRAGGNYRDDLLFNGRVLQGEPSEPADLPDLGARQRTQQGADAADAG
jgi:hypothetical protein